MRSFKEFLAETKIGDLFSDMPDLKFIAFNDVKRKSGTNDFFIDFNDSVLSTFGLTDVSVGDELGDYANVIQVTGNPIYWKITAIADKEKKVYVQPIKENPYANVTSDGKPIGARGYVFTDFDVDVMEGRYEERAINRILDRIGNRDYTSPSDVSYILLGTVPMQTGPQGAQGGWYLTSDPANRGHQKGISTKDIIIKDAASLKKLGFSVPILALTGEIDSRIWDTFVGGSSASSQDRDQLATSDEDYSDPQKMAHNVLNNSNRDIRLRNADILIEYFRKNSSPELQKLIRDTAIALARQEKGGNYEFDDIYGLTKERFVALAGKEQWLDVLKEMSYVNDTSVRSDVAYKYRELRQIDPLKEMLEREVHPKPLAPILFALYDIAFVGKGEGQLPNSYAMPRPEILAELFLSKNPIAQDIVQFVCSVENLKDVAENPSANEYYYREANMALERFTNLCPYV